MFNYSNCNTITCFIQEFIFTVFLAFVCIGLGILLLHVYNRLKDWYRLYKSTKPPLKILFKIYPLFRKTYLFDYYETLRMFYQYVIHAIVFISASIITYNTYMESVSAIGVVRLTGIFATLAMIFGLIAFIISAFIIILDEIILNRFKVSESSNLD